MRGDIGERGADRSEVEGRRHRDQQRAFARHGVFDASHVSYGSREGQHLVQIGHLDEYRALAAGQQPHAKAPSSTPAARSASRTRRASTTAPGVSEWR